MASDKFFSDDYLDRLNPQQQVEQGPVMVFGLTFKNDEERRQYFREELRRRLPELRKIEGFPIGEDDDIINLSDPPYYTACPNPWLNDFIAQWEEEKKELQREGKRKANFEVKEPYASDVSEGKNNPIYNAHIYHTKVPHRAIMRYILHYSQPGDIVLDTFCGTGMTGVASSLSGTNEVQALCNKNFIIGQRHCICSDLSPIASFIASVYNSPVDEVIFKEQAQRVLDKVEKEYGWMYDTIDSIGNHAVIKSVVWSDIFVCPSCGSEIVFYNSTEGNGKKTLRCKKCGSLYEKKGLEKSQETYYDDRTGDSITTTKTVPVKIIYKQGGRGSGIKDLDNFDKELLNKISAFPIDNWFPIDLLNDGYNTHQPMQSNKIFRVHQFYTKRNLIILSAIYKEVYGNPVLMLWFTSQLINVSKMNRYRPEVSFPYNPLNGTLYIGSQTCESNVFDAYKNKIDKFFNAFKFIKHYNVISVGSGTKVSLSNNTIDYIFVDPPFGSNIMYSDLNYIWESWIKIRTNNKEEAIINPYQSKDLFEYQQLMSNSFKEFYRVLKPGKWMTIEFSNTSASVWNSIQNALQGVGFIIANVAALDKKQGSFKAVTTTTAVKQDLVITCYKPSDKLTDKFFQTGGSKENVWDFIDEHLLHLPVHIEKGNATTSVVERSPKILFDRLISYYVQKGFAIPMDAQEFQQGLHERYAERDGMFFTAAQAVEYEEKKLKAPGFVPMGIMVSDEANGIEWLKNELRNNPQTYQDIYPNFIKALNGIRKGDQIPGLNVLLEENFIQNEDGTWRLANIEDDVDLEKLRTKALLKEFKLYLEVCRKPRGKLKDVRVEAVRAGFKQCYSDKNFADIILVGDRIPQNLLTEDEILLQYYDIASSKV